MSRTSDLTLLKMGLVAPPFHHCAVRKSWATIRRRHLMRVPSFARSRLDGMTASGSVSGRIDPSGSLGNQITRGVACYGGPPLVRLSSSTHGRSLRSEEM